MRVCVNQIADTGFEGIREPAPMAFPPHKKFTGMFAMQAMQALSGAVDPPRATADLLDHHRFAEKTHREIFDQVNAVLLLVGMLWMVFAPLNQSRPPR